MASLASMMAHKVGYMVELDDRCKTGDGSADSVQIKTAKHEHCTLLAKACRHGFVPLVEQLLNAGVDPHTICSSDDYRLPLIEAASRMHAKCVEILLDWGANPCAYDCAPVSSSNR